MWKEEEEEELEAMNQKKTDIFHRAQEEGSYVTYSLHLGISYCSTSAFSVPSSDVDRTFEQIFSQRAGKL